MKLKFLGRGASCNPKEGSTSAYFIEKNDLFLIDCGESVFERLMANDLLEGVKNIYVMITHTHSDHIGSLGSLIMYSYYTLGKPINIVLPPNAKHLSCIELILSGFGCTPEMYKYVDPISLDYKYLNFCSLRYCITSHSNQLPCYSLFFRDMRGVVYYTGDTRTVASITALFATEKYDGERVDKIYVDTTTDDFPDNPHLYIGTLAEAVPEELRNRVYCMHFNSDECIEQAKSLGFNVVEIESKKELPKVMR